MGVLGGPSSGRTNLRHQPGYVKNQPRYGRRWHRSFGPAEGGQLGKTALDVRDACDGFHRKRDVLAEYGDERPGVASPNLRFYVENVERRSYRLTIRDWAGSREGLDGAPTGQDPECACDDSPQL